MSSNVLGRKGMKTIDDLPNISGLKEAVEELLNPKDTNETVSEGGGNA